MSDVLRDEIDSLQVLILSSAVIRGDPEQLRMAFIDVRRIASKDPPVLWRSCRRRAFIFFRSPPFEFLGIILIGIETRTALILQHLNSSRSLRFGSIFQILVAQDESKGPVVVRSQLLAVFHVEFEVYWMRLGQNNVIVTTPSVSNVAVDVSRTRI